MSTEVTCHACIELFKVANGRPPLTHEKVKMNKAKPGHECVQCYRAWAFRTAGIEEPADYQTATEAIWDLQ